MKIYTSILFAALLLLSACNNTTNRQESATAPVKRPTTMKVHMKTLNDDLVLNGDVACDEALLRKVYVPCTGRVTTLSVQVGDYVKRGAALATIHSEAAADYRKSISDAESEMRLAQREYNMQQDLKRSQMASDKDVEEAHQRLLVAQAEHKRLQHVAQINGYGSGASANVTLTAPIAGYVINKRIYTDSYVNEENNNEAAIDIADLQRVWVIADVYESDIAKVRQGTEATVTTMAYPDEVFCGRIDKVYSVLDSESKTMKVRVTLDNPNGRLKPGMFASVSVSLSDNGERMAAVPSSAVVFEGGFDYVMVVSGDKYERRKVRVTHVANGNSYIASGVKTGEEVITENALLYFNASENE